MSLSDELRDELAAIAPRRRCCSLAELSALFHSAGDVAPARARRARGAPRPREPGGRAPARLHACCASFGVRSEIRTYRRRAFDRATRYQLHVEVDAARPRCCARRACSRRAARRSSARRSASSAARAAAAPTCAAPLLGAGSLSGPRDAHLELRAAGIDGASLLAEIAAREGIALATLERRTHAAAYAKSTETIADLLAVAGASETALRLDEHGVMAATRAEANRLANADEANVKRTVDAASEQLEAIEQLDVDSAADEAQGDRDAATEATRRSPSRSSPQKCRPQITKAAAHHRMAMLKTLAERRIVPAASGAAEPKRSATVEAGRRGSSEEDLPLRLNHAPDRWRRTGSESDAGRAWTRRGEYLQSGGGRSRGFASRTTSSRRTCARLHRRERRIRRTARAPGGDQRPRPRRVDPRVGPGDDDAAARRGRPRGAARDAQPHHAPEVHGARGRPPARRARRRSSRSTSRTRSRRA